MTRRYGACSNCDNTYLGSDNWCKNCQKTVRRRRYDTTKAKESIVFLAAVVSFNIIYYIDVILKFATGLF